MVVQVGLAMRVTHRFMAIAALVAVASGVLPQSAAAEMSGVVFLDEDGDGAHGEGEPGLAGIVVSNGLTTTATGAEGGYRLADGPDGVAFLVRPDDFAAATWYRTGGGDFALTAAPFPDEFFFIQISDVHAYPDAADYGAWSQPPLPWWMPRFVGSWLVLRYMDDLIPDKDEDDIVESFRAALMPYRDVADAFGPNVLSQYSDEFLTPGSELGKVDAQIRAAVSEVAGLLPSFIISTGDLLLESNAAPREVVERWFAYYDDVFRATGIPSYDTIGNNEIAGIQNDEFDPAAPGYGKGVWKSVRGPTHYSFDRGRFHFVALDTHVPEPKDGNPKRWNFGRMSDDVRAWLAEDLERHRDRVVVALNHEPFHRSDDFGKYKPAEDDGLFERFGVPYVLAGHVHQNGFEESGATTHITTAALSGTRWIVPRALQRRGYRLVYAKGERLYSAFKDLDAPVLGFIAPRGDDRLAPGSKASADPHALSGPVEIVAVACDAKGPFDAVALTLDGKPVPLERWGSFFVHAQLPPLEGAATLTLVATDAVGAQHETELVVAPAIHAAPAD